MLQIFIFKDNRPTTTLKGNNNRETLKELAFVHVLPAMHAPFDLTCKLLKCKCTQEVGLSDILLHVCKVLSHSPGSAMTSSLLAVSTHSAHVSLSGRTLRHVTSPPRGESVHTRPRASLFKQRLRQLWTCRESVCLIDFVLYRGP